MIKRKRKYLSIVLILIAIFSYTPTVAQQSLKINSGTVVLTTDNSVVPKISKDSLFAIREEDIAIIESKVKSSPIGETLWVYFGEIFILGLTVFIYWIRTTLKKHFNKILERITAMSADKLTGYSNLDMSNLGTMNDNIDECLTKIKEITDCKRVLLYQFSNGSHFFSSIPVLRTTVTNTSKDNIISVDSNCFNYETAKEIIHEILNNEYIICQDVPTLKYVGYTSYLMFAKFKNSTLIRLNVGDNYCGIIEIIEPQTFNFSEVKSYILSIGHCFDNYNKTRLPKQV